MEHRFKFPTIKENLQGKSAWIAICSLTVIMDSTTSLSCPAFLSAGLLPKNISDAPPESIKLLRFVNDPKGSAWSPIALQIDPLTKEGIIDSKRSAMGNAFKIEPTDRVVFETKSFGKKFDQTHALPCGATHITELTIPGQHPGEDHAYLVACKDPGVLPQTMSPTVSHDSANHIVTTPTFTYAYQPTNQLLFKSLNTRAGDKEIIAGENSSFLIRMDLMRFFTMNFDNSDVESYVEGTRSGDVGTSAVVNFYLKLLMFKVNLKMATMASFFRDSANIPMIVDVPMDAKNHLNPGSGMLYTFKPIETKLDLTPGAYTTPLAEPERVKKGYKELAQNSESTCAGESCFYRVKGTVDGKFFSIDIVIPRHAVKQGFYPQLITDVPKFKTDMGWKNAKKQDESTLGFYYENSGLDKGRFQMNYWIGFNDGPSGGVCPSPVDVKETFSGQDIADAQAAKESPTH